MMSSDPQTQSVYERCDPAYLRELREAAGMDIHILARNACLSVGQVRELESGAEAHFFYSDTIKRQAYKRVLMLLGVAPPQERAHKHLTQPPPDLDARLVPLDTIAAMSHRPAMAPSFVTTLQTYVSTTMAHKSTLARFVLLVLAVAGVTHYLRLEREAPAQTALVATPNALASTAKANTPTPTPVVAASAPTAAVAVATGSAEFRCAYNRDTLPQWTPTQARKEARYVYLVSSASVDVCVVDGQQRTTHLQMKAGEGQSVYGSAPWQVSSPNLQKIKVYFQGGLVMLPQASTQALSLVAAPATP